jgi:hypothetical protein
MGPGLYPGSQCATQTPGSIRGVPWRLSQMLAKYTGPRLFAVKRLGLGWPKFRQGCDLLRLGKLDCL